MLVRAAGRLSLSGGRLAAARAMGSPKRAAAAPPSVGSNKRGKVDAAASAAADGAPADGAAAAAAAAVRAPPAALRAAQAAEMAALRAISKRNTAAARAVAAAAEAAGVPPPLGALLAEPSWRALLADRLAAPAFAELEAFVAKEWAGPAPVFPPKPLVFRALNSVPVDKVRVVILGQDPYHTLGAAEGLAFSVPAGRPTPSSLRNVFKELQADLGCGPPRGTSLEKWAEQGVLLLNAVLTVRAGAAASHAKRGWEELTAEAVLRLSREREGLVFLLWGKFAQARCAGVDRARHHVLEAPHPSGLSAHRGFLGCRHFSRANALLQAAGEVPIDWRLD